MSTVLGAHGRHAVDPGGLLMACLVMGRIPYAPVNIQKQWKITMLLMQNQL